MASGWTPRELLARYNARQRVSEADYRATRNSELEQSDIRDRLCAEIKARLKTRGALRDDK
jgi:hypothetical protein